LLSICAILACLGLLPQAVKAQSGGTVDVAIVLAVDASASVDAQEYLLQIGGIAHAVSHPSVLSVIGGGRNKAIAISVVTWASVGEQHILLPWTRIDGPAAAQRVSAHLLDSPRQKFIRGGTAIGAALSYSLLMFDRLPWPTERRVIDVSGDGRNSKPPLIRSLRPEIARRDVVINGLPVTDNDSGLARYYRDIVISGYGAFSVPTYSFETFPDAFRIKLMREIRGGAMVSMQR